MVDQRAGAATAGGRGVPPKPDAPLARDPPRMVIEMVVPVSGAVLCVSLSFGFLMGCCLREEAGGKFVNKRFDPFLSFFGRDELKR